MSYSTPYASMIEDALSRRIGDSRASNVRVVGCRVPNVSEEDALAGMLQRHAHADGVIILAIDGNITSWVLRVHEIAMGLGRNPIIATSLRGNALADAIRQWMDLDIYPQGYGGGIPVVEINANANLDGAGIENLLAHL